MGAVVTEAWRRELERRSAFVWMTTVPPEELSARDVLKEYKGQVHVERHFHFLKDPLFVGALYVKKPKRVEALGYVLLLACLLYSLLERRLRAAAVPIPSPSRRVLTHPTGHDVVRHLARVQVTHDATGQSGPFAKNFPRNLRGHLGGPSHPNERLCRAALTRSTTETP